MVDSKQPLKTIYKQKIWHADFHAIKNQDKKGEDTVSHR